MYPSPPLYEVSFEPNAIPENGVNLLLVWYL